MLLGGHSQTDFLSLQENNMIVYVEKKVLEDPAIANDENFGPVKKKFCTFREGMEMISWKDSWSVFLFLSWCFLSCWVKFVKLSCLLHTVVVTS